MDKIEHIDPKALIPHPENSLKHGEGQITQLVASFEQFGFNGVITIDENNVVLAGHGRRLAAIRLGMPSVPCLRRAGLSESQKRAYIIADNQIGRNSEWDEEIFARQLEQLHRDGFDLEILGIGAEALASIQPGPSRTAAEVRELEKNTDSSPVDRETFEKELSSKTASGLLPIIPIYAEHHEAFVIICDNAIDEAWLRHKLGLEKPQQSYKDSKFGKTNVVTIQQLRELLS